jgi:molybdopterin converting factor small subunit
MITVKLYGLLRNESGIKAEQMEVSTLKEVFGILEDCGISRKNLNSCMILINGKSEKERTKLNDGDTAVLRPPVPGG